MSDEDESEASDEELRAKGIFVQDEDQAKRAAPDLIKSFKTPLNAWGFGAGIPEVLTIDYYRMFTAKWGIHAYLSAPVPYTINLQQELQQQNPAPSLLIATPAASVPIQLLYGPYAGIDGMYFPYASNFFFSFGLGYRRLQVKGKVDAPLYVCLADPANDCDETIAINSTNPSRMNIQMDYVSQSIMWRGGLGWFKPLNRSQYLAIVAFGLTKAVRTYRRSSSSAELDGDTKSFLNKLKSGAADSADQLLADKKDQIENRTADRAAPIENIGLPTVTIGTGWLF